MIPGFLNSVLGSLDPAMLAGMLVELLKTPEQIEGLRRGMRNLELSPATRQRMIEIADIIKGELEHGQARSVEEKTDARPALPA